MWSPTFSRTGDATQCDLLITNGIIVTPSDLMYPPASDIAIRDGKILCIGALIDILNADKVIDADGGYVTLGGVDTHVHLDQVSPIGAIAGGTTTIISFALQKKSDESVLPIIEAYHEKARNNAYCDYSLHLILTNPTPHILNNELPLLATQGTTSAKLYMTYDAMKLPDRSILTTLITTRALGMTTMLHAENSDMISLITDSLLAQNKTAPYYHAIARPKIVEDEATYRAISMAQLVDAPILLAHISSKGAAQHIRNARTKCLPIHAETCPQYLYLMSDSLKDESGGFEGAKHVCSPPLRDSMADLDALWDGIANGTFTTFSSDHAPFSYGNPRGKQLGVKDGVARFTDIPNGLPSLETRLPLLYKGAQNERITIQKFVEVASANLAGLYGLERKGSIVPGYDADLVIWYPDEKFEKFELRMRC